MKSIRIQGFSGPYFLAFRLNTEVYWLFYKSTFSVQMWENKDQKNFEYGHFLRSVDHYFFPKSELVNRSSSCIMKDDAV